MTDPRLATCPTVRAEAERLAREAHGSLVSIARAAGDGCVSWEQSADREYAIAAHLALLCDLTRDESRDKIARMVAGKLGLVCGATAPEWQRLAGLVGSRPYVGIGTWVDLVYCEDCANQINDANDAPICVPMAPDVVVVSTPSEPRMPRLGRHAAAFLLAAGALTGRGDDPFAALDSAPKPRDPTDADREALARAEERREKKRARNLRNQENR